MKYQNIVEGIFIDRPNRFVASVEIEGKQERVHVKNTGRCRELLIPGTEVYLEDFSERMGSRKLRYSLIGVNKQGMMINMDSQAPNQAAREALVCGRLFLPQMKGLTEVKGEQVFGSSRLDFYVKDENGAEGFVEVKGVTLEENGIAKFPDAPTKRGIKHIRELILAKKQGYYAYLLFIIQMKGTTVFQPNDRTHAAFGDSLREAEKAGVSLLAYDCMVTKDSMILDQPVPIELNSQNPQKKVVNQDR